MNGTVYSTRRAADDAAEYAAAVAILREDPCDADALATIAALDARYGEGFFED